VNSHPIIPYLLSLVILLAESRISPIITEKVASLNLPQNLSTALSEMTGIYRDIAILWFYSRLNFV
jgi:hypothetical protein